MESRVTEFLSEYGMFLAKTLTLVLAVLFLLAAALGNAMKGRKVMERGSLRVTHLNRDIEKLQNEIKKVVLHKRLLKLEGKAEKKRAKAEDKALKKSAGEARRRVFVIDFEGDIKASQVSGLRQVVTAVLSVARPEQDEVLLRLESPGGVVHGYGLAASQLNRIRKRGLPLTVCVDKMAASGGYMMACVGSRIFSAPFAYIGSVGVVIQLPNFHRLMQDKKIDYEMITAGEYKRTLTLFGENTDRDREKVAEDVRDAHELFKNFIREHRPALDVDAIATGEVWFGTRAREKGLVDELKTSDEYIVEACENADVYHVCYEQTKKMGRRLGRMLERAFDSAFWNWAQKTERERFFS